MTDVMPQENLTGVVALAAALLLALYVLATAWWSHRRYRRFNRIAYNESTRSHWAEARAAEHNTGVVDPTPTPNTTEEPHD